MMFCNCFQNVLQKIEGVPIHHSHAFFAHSASPYTHHLCSTGTTPSIPRVRIFRIEMNQPSSKRHRRVIAQLKNVVEAQMLLLKTRLNAAIDDAFEEVNEVDSEELNSEGEFIPENDDQESSSSIEEEEDDGEDEEDEEDEDDDDEEEDIKPPKKRAKKFIDDEADDGKKSRENDDSSDEESLSEESEDEKEEEDEVSEESEEEVHSDMVANTGGAGHGHGGPGL